MFRKSSIWLLVFISVVTLAFIASGCAKKQLVKEETLAKPSVEAKKEAPKPEVPKTGEQPKAAPTPASVTQSKLEAKKEAPKEAIRQAEKKPAFDLNGMRIQFAFDDYSLSPKSREDLDKIGAWMAKNLSTQIRIEGNTCDIGTEEYNLAFGDRRATSAKQYLERLGVETFRLSALSYGEEKPRFPNTDEANRSMNRRDDLVVVK